MVYIFGIDIPLMELLLVYSFLASYFLILVFLQMRKLSRLMKLEKGDIELMEKQSSDPVDKFINEARKRGYSKKEVKKLLIDNGWEKEEADRVLVRY